MPASTRSSRKIGPATKRRPARTPAQRLLKKKERLHNWYVKNSSKVKKAARVWEVVNREKVKVNARVRYAKRWASMPPDKLLFEKAERARRWKNWADQNREKLHAKDKARNLATVADETKRRARCERVRLNRANNEGLRLRRNTKQKELYHNDPAVRTRCLNYCKAYREAPLMVQLRKAMKADPKIKAAQKKLRRLRRAAMTSEQLANDRLKSKIYRTNNRKKLLAHRRETYNENPEFFRAVQENWRRDNPEKVKASNVSSRQKRKVSSMIISVKIAPRTKRVQSARDLLPPRKRVA